MKLNELKKIVKIELHEKIIGGRRLDRYATAFSREIIIALKDEDLQTHIHDNEEATFTLTTELLEELNWVRDVIVNVKVFETKKDSVVSGSYDWILDDPEQNVDEKSRALSDIYVYIELPQNYSNKEFANLIPRIKEVFRHELEHSSQPTEMLRSTYEKIPDKEVWKTLDTAENYYTDEAEIKAHVAGLYKKAKTEKKPVEEVFDTALDEIFHTGLHYGYAEKDLIPIVRRTRELWRYYAMSRYPHAGIVLEPDEHSEES